jgi:hypothetical protein
VRLSERTRSERVTVVDPSLAMEPPGGVKTSVPPGRCRHRSDFFVIAVTSNETERGKPKFTGQSWLDWISVSSMHSCPPRASGFRTVTVQVPAEDARVPQSITSGDGLGDGSGLGSGLGDGLGDGLGSGLGDGRGDGEGWGEGSGLGEGSELGEGSGLGIGAPRTFTRTVAVADAVPAWAVSW